MKHPASLRHGLLVLSLGLAALPVWADDDCDAPLNRWHVRLCGKWPPHRAGRSSG